FVHIPIWLATGGRDSNPTPAMAQYSEDRVKEVGGNIRRSLYADLGHASWYRHWEEPDFVPYMLNAHKANPHVFFNTYEFCPGDVINGRTGLPTGCHSDEWRRDGVLIASKYGPGGANTIHNAASVISYTGNEIRVRLTGSYSARFRRTATGAWSDWSLVPADI